MVGVVGSGGELVVVVVVAPNIVAVVQEDPQAIEAEVGLGKVFLHHAQCFHDVQLLCGAQNPCGLEVELGGACGSSKYSGGGAAGSPGNRGKV